MSKSKVKAGEAYVELGIKSRIASGMRAAEKQLKQRGQALMKIGSLVTASTAGLLAGPIKAASEMQETMGKFETVFGESAAAMSKWSQATAEAMGVSRQEMASMLSGLQDLLVPMGMAPDEAAGLSKELSKLAVDLGSFNNMDTASVMRDLMAAMTGSGETMKKYGAIVDAAATKQELLNMGLDPKAATNAEKAQARFALIMRNTTAAQGDAIRTSGSFANQTKRLGAILKDTLAAMGGPIIKDVATLVSLIGKGAAKVRTFVQENSGLVRVIGLAAIGIGGLGAAMVTIGGLMTAVGAAVGGMATVLGALASPLGIAAAAVAGLGFAFFKFTDVGQRAIGVLQERFAPLVETVQNAVSQITAALSAGDMNKAWELTADLLEMVWLDLTGEIRDAWDAAMDFIFNAGSSTAKAIGQAFQALAGFLDGMLRRYEKHYNKLTGGIQDFLTEAGGTRVIGGNSGQAGQGAFASSFGGAKQSIQSVIGQIDQFGRELERSADGQMEQRRAEREAARQARMARLNALRAGFSQPSESAIEDATGKSKPSKKQQTSVDLNGLIDQFKSAAKGSRGSGDQAATGGTRSTGTFSAFGAAVAAGPQVKMLSLTQSIEMSTKRAADGIVMVADALNKGKGAIGAATGIGGLVGGTAIGGLVKDQATKLLTQLVQNTGRALGYQKKGTVAKFQ